MNNLPTRTLGRHGPGVSVICLGTWPLGGGFGAIDEEQAIRTVHAALDAGANFVDTAEGYKASEATLGKALAGRRDQVILATKLSGDHSRQHIRAAVENSLRQLRTDYIDLYQIHRPRPQWPIEDTMAELVKLQEEGKVRYLGLSNFDVEQTAAALAHGPIASSQPHYSMLYRGIEDDLLPYCLDQGIGVMVYAPITRGLLSGKYRASHAFAPDDDRAHQRRTQPGGPPGGHRDCQPARALGAGPRLHHGPARHRLDAGPSGRHFGHLRRHDAGAGG